MNVGRKHIERRGSRRRLLAQTANRSQCGQVAQSICFSEIIIRLDWSDLAGLISTSTVDVANVVADYLLESPRTLFLQNPIHLIGHSRGASLMTRLAQRFAQRGIWVDQFTSLDPHPVDG